MFVPHNMDKEELLQHISVITRRPQMYGVEPLIECVLRNAWYFLKNHEE
jgi:hypothetical protein